MPKGLQGSLCGDVVPPSGLEPLRLAAPDPKSGASANFTTAVCLIKLPLYYSKCRRPLASDFMRSWERSFPRAGLRMLFPVVNLPPLPKRFLVFPFRRRHFSVERRYLSSIQR